MKARPLSLLPHLAHFALYMLRLCGVCSWNAGIDVIYYRGERDHIGFHADDDQAEDTIATVIVQSPGMERSVIVQTNTTITSLKDKRQYILHLQAGDVYVMDEEMQKKYVHGVPKKKPSPKSVLLLCFVMGSLHLSKRILATH